MGEASHPGPPEDEADLLALIAAYEAQEAVAGDATEDEAAELGEKYIADCDRDDYDYDAQDRMDSRDY